MKTYSVTYEVERGEDVIELEIRGTVSPYIPAKLSGHPDTWAPAEGGEVEITDIYVTKDGKRVKWDGELTEDEEERVRERLQEEAADDDSDFEEPDDDDDDDDDYDPPSGREDD